MSPKLSVQMQDEIEEYILKGDTIQQIRAHILINVRQINQMKRNMKRFDNVIVFKISIQGRFRIFSSEMKTVLLKYLNQKFDAYCDKMCWFFYDEFEIVMTKKIINIIFNHLNWIRKKIENFEINEILYSLMFIYCRLNIALFNKIKHFMMNGEFVCVIEILNNWYF